VSVIYVPHRVAASARNRLRQQEDFCDQMAAAQRRLVASGRRPEMIAAFHSVRRDQWLETTIADISADMGLRRLHGMGVRVDCRISADVTLMP
jgi:hypothetical protein